MMNRQLTSLAAALAIAMPAFAQDDTAQRAAHVCFNAEGEAVAMVRRYYECITQNAARLEPSGAQPDQIATAAASSCIDGLTAIDRLFDQCQLAFEDIIGNSYASSSKQVVREGAQSTAITTIIEMRAERAAK